MERYYQPIDGKNITFDKYVIAEVLGAAGEVIESTATYFGKPIQKYAFYNTGELCEVLVEEGRQTICVKCLGHRAKDITGWLMKYLKNGMRAYGWETEFPEVRDDYFYAAFYQEDAE